MRPQAIILRGLAILVPVAGGGLFLAFHVDRHVALRFLRDHDQALHALVADYPTLAPIVFVAAYAVVVACSLPGSTAMTIAGGILFGFRAGAALAVVGATAGAILIFLLVRFVFDEAFVRRHAGAFLNRLAAKFEHDAFWYLLFLRLVPAFPFWAVNLAAAFTAIRLRSFAAATAVGIVPGTLAFAAIGDGFELYVGSGQEQAGGAGLTPGVIATRSGLALLALLPVLVRWGLQRWRR